MAEPPVERRRSYGWTAIESVGPPLAGRTGLDYFRALKDGTLSPQPITATIGWNVVAVEEGHVRLSLEPSEHLLQASGRVHGGVLATLLDSATAAAGMTVASEGAACSTLQLNIQFLRPVLGDGPTLFAEGNVTHRGRQVVTAEGRVEDADGRVYARATATLLLGETRSG